MITLLNEVILNTKKIINNIEISCNEFNDGYITVDWAIDLPDIYKNWHHLLDIYGNRLIIRNNISLIGDDIEGNFSAIEQNILLKILFHGDKPPKYYRMVINDQILGNITHKEWFYGEDYYICNN